MMNLILTLWNSQKNKNVRDITLAINCLHILFKRNDLTGITLCSLELVINIWQCVGKQKNISRIQNNCI